MSGDLGETRVKRPIRPEDTVGRVRLERVGIRDRLLRDLASNALTNGMLAARYGVSPSAISDFRKRHQTEIAEIRRREDDHFWGLWAAEKRARVITYQAQVERFTDELDKLLDGKPRTLMDPITSEAVEVNERDPTALARMAKIVQTALRSIAEELGELPSRTIIEGGVEPVRHVLEIETTGDDGLS